MPGFGGRAHADGLPSEAQGYTFNLTSNAGQDAGQDGAKTPCVCAALIGTVAKNPGRRGQGLGEWVGGHLEVQEVPGAAAAQWAARAGAHGATTWAGSARAALPPRNHGVPGRMQVAPRCGP